MTHNYTKIRIPRISDQLSAEQVYERTQHHGIGETLQEKLETFHAARELETKKQATKANDLYRSLLAHTITQSSWVQRLAHASSYVCDTIVNTALAIKIPNVVRSAGIRTLLENSSNKLRAIQALYNESPTKEDQQTLAQVSLENRVVATEMTTYISKNPSSPVSKTVQEYSLRVDPLIERLPLETVTALSQVESQQTETYRALVLLSDQCYNKVERSQIQNAIFNAVSHSQDQTKTADTMVQAARQYMQKGNEESMQKANMLIGMTYKALSSAKKKEYITSLLDPILLEGNVKLQHCVSLYAKALAKKGDVITSRKMYKSLLSLSENTQIAKESIFTMQNLEANPWLIRQANTYAANQWKQGNAHIADTVYARAIDSIDSVEYAVIRDDLEQTILGKKEQRARVQLDVSRRVMQSGEHDLGYKLFNRAIDPRNVA